MYRDYEDARTLEQELAEAKQNYEAILAKGNTDGDTLYHMYCNIRELEDRINFAWQDEEFDMMQG